MSSLQFLSKFVPNFNETATDDTEPMLLRSEIEVLKSQVAQLTEAVRLLSEQNVELKNEIRWNQEEERVRFMMEDAILKDLKTVKETVAQNKAELNEAIISYTILSRV
jgi:hypothetical protein